MKASLLLAVIILSSCSSTGTMIADAFAKAQDVGRVTAPYDEAAFAPYAAPGTAVVTGQAFEKTNGGDVKYAAGYTIRLLPATPYSNDYLAQTTAHKNLAGVGMFASGRFAGDAEKLQAMHSHELTTVADGSGHFEFRNVPAGFYHIYVRIEWLAGGETTGGVASAGVTVEDGKTYNVIVTG